MVAESNLTPLKQFRYWLWFALAYGFAFGIAFFTIDTFLGATMSAFAQGIVLSVIYSITLVTVILVGAWSVLGPGQLWKRLIIANAFGLIVLAGLIVAIFCGETPMEDKSSMAGYCCIGFLCLTVSSQIVFWILRGFFGWQFVYQDQLPRAALTLSEIFIIIFMFAALSSAPNWIAKMAAEQEVSMLEVGASSYTMVQQPDNSFMMKEELVTAENIERIRREKTEEASSHGVTSVLTMLGYATTAGLFIAPVFWFMFRSKTLRDGWIRSLIYGSMLACVVGQAVAMFFFGGNFPLEAIVACLFGGAFSALVLGWPLAISRRRGFALVTSRQNSHRVGEALSEPALESVA